MIEKIDTRHGTANQHNFSNGNCLPYTGVPFGMNYFAPQTSDQRDNWWFHPQDHTFQGYRLTHQPSPWMGDFAHVLLTPVSGDFEKISLSQLQSSYRPNEAVFKPYKLIIQQLRYAILSCLVPSMYGGCLSIDYSQEKNGLVLTVPGLKTVNLIDSQKVHISLSNYSGCEDDSFTFYLSLHFASPVVSWQQSAEKEQTFLNFQFGNIPHQKVQFTTSFISQEQANLNLKREKDFTKTDYLSHSKSAWQEYFERIQVTHSHQDHSRTFYHNLYRVFLFPQTFYEIEATGKKIHYDTFNKKVRSGILYTNNGFWDTYKTVYPFFSLFAQEKYEEILEGLLNSYKETGFLPKWLSPDERGLMPGTLIDAVIADAAIKDIRPDLMPTFLEAMKKSATLQSEKKNYGRQGTLDYLKYGYVPNHYHESVNHTLDYAYSDFCISQVAKTLSEKNLTAYYRKQALNYQHIFDPISQFMRGKDQEGNFTSGFSSYRWGGDYAEGSAWQSSFAVFQDFQGLINLMGGEKNFTKKLISLCNQKPAFTIGSYPIEIHEMSEMAAIKFGQLAISNQPSFHYPYLFSYVGKPEMAQPLLRNLLTECFSAEENGYPGDEDNGSMSGWYLFNSLGFYPVTPGTGEYLIGMPLVKQAKLKLSNGKKLTITTTPNENQHVFLHQTLRNGKPHSKLFFDHHELMSGGKIDFKLGIVPNPRNYNPESLPFSLSSSH